jgi:hypothetical protein
MDDLTDIAKRIEAGNRAHGLILPADYQDEAIPPPPRWRISPRWIEFECGCVGERCLTLVDPRSWDPVIFQDTAQQAVYDRVCDFHAPSMNDRLGMGGIYRDFVSWHRHRRAGLMGRVKP